MEIAFSSSVTIPITSSSILLLHIDKEIQAHQKNKANNVAVSELLF
jgi:hypothetical protein